MRHLLAAMCAFGLLISGPGLSRADGDSLNDTLSARAVGAGEALRASAIGGAATTLNPAGAALTRSYIIEGGYGFRPDDDATVLGASICDSVTKPWLAACAYYNYFSANPEGGGRSLHDVGLTLALPFGDRFMAGVTGRYIDYVEEGVDAMPEDNSRDGAFVMDAGLILRIVPTFNLAFVGYNVVGHDGDNFPRGLGTGVAFQASPKVQISGDALWNLDAPEGESTGRYSAGAELFIAAEDGQQGYPIRAGYIYDVANGGSYFTAGLGFANPRVGLDVGLRKQVAGDDGGDELLVQFGLRLFMPAQ